MFNQLNIFDPSGDKKKQQSSSASGKESKSKLHVLFTNLLLGGVILYPFAIVGGVIFFAIKLVESIDIRKNSDNFEYEGFVKKNTLLWGIISIVFVSINFISAFFMVPSGYLSAYLLFPFNLFTNALRFNHETITALLIGGVGISSLLLTISSFIDNRKVVSIEDKIKKVQGSKAYQNRAENKFKVAQKRNVAYDQEYQLAISTNDYTELSRLKEQVLLGEDEFGKPYYMSFKELGEMAFGVGTTGAGKTTFLAQYVEHCIKFFIPCFYMDGKGSQDTIDEFQAMAKRYNRNFKVFNDTNAVKYNPIKYGNSVMVHDRLLSMIQTESAYYTGASEILLQSLIQLIDEFDLSRTLKTVVKYFEPEPVLRLFLNAISHFHDYDKSGINAYSKFDKEAPIDEDVSLFEQVDSKFTGLSSKKQKLFNQLFKRYQYEKDGIYYLFVNSGGLKNQLYLLLDSELGTLFDTEGNEDHELDLVKMNQKNELVYVTLNGLVYDKFIHTLGGFIISDIKYMLAEKFINSDDSPFLFICDEPNSYMTMDYINAFNKGRGAGLHAVTSPQTLADIDMIDEFLLKRLIGNCNTYFVGKTNHPEEVSFWAELFGTYKDIEVTSMIEQQSGLSDVNKADWVAEKGSRKEVDKFKIHPNDIKNLRVGEYIIYRKAMNVRERPMIVYARNPVLLVTKKDHRVQKINTFNPKE